MTTPVANELWARVRSALREHHFRRRPERAYLRWMRRFVAFHGGRHPEKLGERHVHAFVDDVASEQRSPASLRQAVSAVLFLYQRVLGRDVGWLADVAHASASRPARRRRQGPAARAA